MPLSFIVKKFFAAFLFPLSLFFEVSAVGLCLLLFTRFQRTGKAIVLAAIVALALLSTRVVSEGLLAPLEAKYPPLVLTPSQQENLHWIVVLGGGQNPDPRLPATARVANTALARLCEGIRLLRLAPQAKLIVSGGAVFDPVPEAVTLREAAIELGVPTERIVLEDRSRDTEAEAEEIEKMIGNQRFVLVTSAAHLPRAMALFTHRGLDPIPAPAGHLFQQEGQFLRGLLPGVGNLSKSHTAVYEYLGFLWAKLRQKV